MRATPDAQYKQLFAHPEMMCELLRGFVPYSWAQHLDVAVFERVGASYVGDHGQQRHDDMVWRLRIGREWIYIYLLLEFQSKSDPWMALRMQVYVGLLYQDIVRQHHLTSDGKLPPVLPIVLYHGAAAWHASTDMVGLMMPPPEGLEAFQPAQRYFLIDRSLRDGANGNLVGALFDLIEARTDAAIKTVLMRVAERLQEPDMAPARDSVSRWILLTLQRAFPKTNIHVDRSLKETEAMMHIQYERYEDLLEEEAIQRGEKIGLERGRQEGLQEGLQEGTLQTSRNFLRLLVSRDLGGVPARAAAIIDKAGHEVAQGWIERLVNGERADIVLRIQEHQPGTE